MPTIKAIETVYNGYRFRSRLEARWAVFFDALGVKYEYEKEGFDLDGVRYLPDFWLPDLQCWVEIKPEFRPEEAYKTARLARLSGYEVFVCDYPDFSEPRYDFDRSFQGAWIRCHWPHAKDDEADFGLYWFECGDCLLDVESNPWKDAPFVGIKNSECHLKHSRLAGHDLDHGSKYSMRLSRAYTAARQARFEHGETPSGLIPATATHDLVWWQAQWTAFVGWLRDADREGRRLAARLKFAQPTALVNSELTLTFRYSIHFDKFDQSGNRALRLVRYLKDFSGEPVAVKIEPPAPDQAGTYEKTRWEILAEDPAVRRAIAAGCNIAEIERRLVNNQRNADK